MGFLFRDDKNGEYSRIIIDFPSECDLPYQHFVETIWDVLMKCHNWCCSPKLAEDLKWKEFFENYEELKVTDILK